MARMENLYVWEGKLDCSGWNVSHVGVNDCLVVSEDELLQLLTEKD